jgi:glycosyltransferase involved in cell wall biosynthesis
VVGDAALLVAASNPAQLREALVRLMGDAQLRERLGAAARARVEAHFTWPIVAARTAEILESESLAQSPAVL